MTSTTTNTILAGPSTTILSRVGAFFTAFIDAQSRADQITKLQAMSDAELAERGLTRDAIVHHVFSDKLYL